MSFIPEKLVSRNDGYPPGVSGRDVDGPLTPRESPTSEERREETLLERHEAADRAYQAEEEEALRDK